MANRYQLKLPTVLTKAALLVLCSMRLAVPEITPDDNDLVNIGRRSREAKYSPHAPDDLPLTSPLPWNAAAGMAARANQTQAQDQNVHRTVNNSRESSF